MDEGRQKIDRQIGWTLWTLGIAFGVGEFAAAFAVSMRTGAARGWAAVLWGGAFTVIGFVGGFLFGVPRSTTDNNKVHLQVNTNLEQISDWLTKIITGAALASLKDLPGVIKRAASYVAQSLAGCFSGGRCVDSNELASTGGAIFAFFLSLGFLFGYLATRTFFTRLFSASDLSLEDAVSNLSSDSKKSLLAAPVNLDQPPPTLDPGAAQAAAALQAAPVNVDASPEALVLLAKAKLVNGKWDEAVQAYKNAVSKDPANAQILLEYAYVLQRTGHLPSEVQKQLDQALESAKSSSDKGLKRRVYESATYQALYLPAPDGFERAIRLGEEYTRDASNAPSGAVWVNLACAYGQKVRWLKTNQPSQDTGQLRNAALAAARNAMTIDSKWKGTLHALMKPSDDQAARGENDLEVFADDPDFKTLLEDAEGGGK